MYLEFAYPRPVSAFWISLSCPVQLTGMEASWERLWHEENIIFLSYQIASNIFSEGINPVEQLFKDLLFLYCKTDENLIPQIFRLQILKERHRKQFTMKEKVPLFFSIRRRICGENDFSLRILLT
jgi:hypothetical protein